jgi:hypothetical protein
MYFPPVLVYCVKKSLAILVCWLIDAAPIYLERAFVSDDRNRPPESSLEGRCEVVVVKAGKVDRSLEEGVRARCKKNLTLS